MTQFLCLSALSLAEHLTSSTHSEGTFQRVPIVQYECLRFASFDCSGLFHEPAFESAAVQLASPSSSTRSLNAHTQPWALIAKAQSKVLDADP